MNLKEQVELIAKNLAEKTEPLLGNRVNYKLGEAHAITLTAKDKEISFNLTNTQIRDLNIRELRFVCDSLENHNYTELSFVVLVNQSSGDFDYVDYPPFRRIVQHFLDN